MKHGIKGNKKLNPKEGNQRQNLFSIKAVERKLHRQYQPQQQHNLKKIIMETIAVSESIAPIGLQGNATSQSGQSSGDATASQASVSAPQPQVVVIKPYPHEEVMKANGLEKSKLPKEIKMKFNTWEMGVNKYKNQKTEKLRDMVEKGSIAIANEIQDWVEKDLPEKSEEETQAELKAKQEAEEKVKAKQDADALREKQEADTKLRIRQEAENKSKEEAKRRQAVIAENKLTPEQKQQREILKSLDSKGKIDYRKLSEIIGRSVGLSAVKVGSMVLHNEYMTNNYYIYSK
jgi:hypothetical protein